MILNSCVQMTTLAFLTEFVTTINSVRCDLSCLMVASYQKLYVYCLQTSVVIIITATSYYTYYWQSCSKPQKHGNMLSTVDD